MSFGTGVLFGAALLDLFPSALSAAESSGSSKALVFPFASFGGLLIFCIGEAATRYRANSVGNRAAGRVSASFLIVHSTLDGTATRTLAPRLASCTIVSPRFTVSAGVHVSAAPRWRTCSSGIAAPQELSLSPPVRPTSIREAVLSKCLRLLNRQTSRSSGRSAALASGRYRSGANHV